jgi:lipopolysaccharide transport system ATP-binding protein
MKPILEINNISKKFKLYHEVKPYLSLRDSISGMFRQNISSNEEFYALRNVTFEVNVGDSIGIVGKNGSGKSTLLKILSKITPPSEGRIISRGRIASLLEVGTGFHPELTGRENVFLNGSILGMTKAEIRSKFDEIIDFSGTEKFLDTPLKHYSSGMQLRLAFAVAAFLEPEILIIDEVLAVGDAEFQKKCMGKMEDASKKEGKTILFVSHDLNAITNLTKKAVLLKAGKVDAFDSSVKIVERYLQNGASQAFYQKEIINDIPHPLISSINVNTSMGESTHVAEEPLTIEIEINVPQDVPKSVTWMSVQISDFKERGCVHVSTNSRETNLCKEPGIQKIICSFPNLKLYQGRYHVNVYLAGPPGEKIYDVVKNVCPFEVIIIGKEFDWKWNPEICTYFEEVEWRTEVVSDVTVLGS